MGVAMSAARVGGPFVLLKDYFAAIAAIILWIVNILSATAWRHEVSGQPGRLIGGAAVTMSVWALLRHYRGGVKLGPGERIISPGDVSSLEQTMAASMERTMSGDDKEQGGERHLKPRLDRGG